MSEFKNTYVLTSESVSEGHPDKVCDQISDAILDACLASDSESRVACETLATTNLVTVAGEITTKSRFNTEAIVRQVVKDIGYTYPDCNFAADDLRVMIALHKQSQDIARGVDSDFDKEQGAGDQGMMFGFACSETDALMPAPIYYAHRLVEHFAQLRHSGEYSFLRPDAKSQISFVYEGNRPIRINNIVLSHQHSESMLEGALRDLVMQEVPKVIPEQYLEDVKYHVNPTGRFVIGGPDGDCGLTGRKIIVDTYGGIGRHGGGAFSGKDPSKVDRSAAYMARYVAKNIVASGLAEKCEIQVSYAIGEARPLSICVNTFGTGQVADAAIADKLLNGDIFDFRPNSIITALSLKHPSGWSYRDTASYGHFGREQFPWEKTDKVEELKKAF